jgi:hypothetical protein
MKKTEENTNEENNVYIVFARNTVLYSRISEEIRWGERRKGSLPIPFYSRLLGRYLKTKCTVFFPLGFCTVSGSACRSFFILVRSARQTSIGCKHCYPFRAKVFR